MWRLSDGGIHFSMLNMYVLLQGSPGKLRHSYRLDAAGNADDFPASKGRGETLGKGAFITAHIILRVKTICSDHTSMCFHGVPTGSDGTDLEWCHFIKCLCLWCLDYTLHTDA